MQAADEKLVLSLYDHIVETATLEPTLAALAQRFSCQSASIVAFDPLTPRASIAVGAGSFDEAAKRRYESEFIAHDPAPKAYTALASGTVVASNRLFSSDVLRNSVMLHEFLRPLGIEETLGGTVSARDGRFGFLTVHRGRDRAPFEDDEIASLEMMLPHVSRSLQLRRAFARLQADAGLLGGMIDRLTAGVVICRDDGSVVHVNRAAHAMAAREDGLWFDRKGVLHAADRAADRMLTKFHFDAAAGGAGGIVRVPRRDQRQPYAVLVAPAPGATARDMVSGMERRGILILLHDPDAQAPDTAQTLATVFGMPPGAARLVEALMQGDDTRTYAERTRVSYETVRYHLKTAFARTGARTQSRLMQLVTRAITEFGDRRD